jgi:mono/diheme cytochrome c family protein
MRAMLVLVLAASGCEGVFPEFDWQQMIDQFKFQPYEACQFFPDGRAMQTPPLGTVPHDRIVGRPALTSGLVDGKYVDDIPVPLTRELMSAGRFSFETYCAACHGLDGSGDSPVAVNMELRKPPSLLTEPVRSFPPGRVFQVASDGYGLMPSYALELSTRERWAVVAYLRALQLSQAVKLATLPPPLRQQAEAALSSISKGYVKPTAGERPAGKAPEQAP